ncbi:MAG: TonB-dependent receptor domain-containing protein [Opitutales bacterium]
MSPSPCSARTCALLLVACFICPFPLPGQSGSGPAIRSLDPLEARGDNEPFPDAAGPALLGLPLPEIAVPRSATTLGEPVLSLADAPADLTVWVPGAVATAQFGHFTTPTIRGDVAESYVNGQRRSANLFGYQPELYPVDSLSVVKGPANGILGAGFYTGGYVNAETRIARLGTNAARLTLDLGQGAPGGESWTDVEAVLDVNRVIEPGIAAVRVLAHARQDDTRLINPAAQNDGEGVFLNVNWKPEEGWRVRVNGSYQRQRAPQLLGVNRPSPELMADNTYFTGFATGFPQVIDPTGTVAIDPGASLLSEEDFSDAEVGWVQLLVDREIDDDRRWVSRTLLEGVDRRREHGFQYLEYVEQLTVDQRWEWHGVTTWDGRELTWVAGPALRYEERTGYVNFFNELASSFDISGGQTRFVATETFGFLTLPGQPGPDGRPFFAGPLSPETTASRLWNAGLFGQAALALTPETQLTLGLRGDWLHADVRDPLTPNGAEDSTGATTYNVNLGLSHRLRPGWRASVTAVRSHAAEGSVAGGGIMLGADGTVAEASLRNRSDLLEAGLRGRLREGRLSVDLTAFYQTRSRLEVRGTRSDLEVKGLETELAWRPEALPGSWFFLNAAYQNGHYVDSAPGQLGGRSIYDLYAPGTGPGGRGTGVGFDHFFLNQVEPGDWRIPGLSRWQLAAGGQVPLADRFTTTLWGEWQSDQPGNLDDEFRIPARLMLHARLAWRPSPAWELAVTGRNLLDTDSWIHNGQTFFNNQLVSRTQPRRFSLRVERRW